MSLRQKLLLTFLFVVIIPITLLGMIIIELIMTRSDENIANAVEYELTMAQDYYQQQAEIVGLGTKQASIVLSGNEAISADNQALLQPTLQAWGQIHPQIDIWLISNTQGQIMAHFAPTEANIPATTPFMSLLNKSLTTGQTEISTELWDGTTTTQSDMVQVVVVPFGPEKSSDGVIMAIDYLDNNLFSRPSQAGYAYSYSIEETIPHTPLIFITQQHQIVTTSATDLNPEQILSPEILESIYRPLNASWSYRGRHDINSTPYQLAAKPIFDSNQQVIGSFFVGLPYRRYFGLQAQTGWIVTGMLVFSAVISFIVASLLASAITQPVQNLIKKSALLAQGDLSVRASVYGKDEIAQLGHAFNKMATQLEKSYEELAQERRRALAIIEASADGIWVTKKQTDGSRQISIVNSALEYMTGHNRTKLVQKQCDDLLGICTPGPGQKSLCNTSCPFTHPHQNNGMVHGLLPTGKGESIPVEISYGHLTNSQGELTGLVHIMRDLTLRKEVEKLKADFISMVSHELRTPLSHIKGFASTLLQPDVSWDRETQRDFLGSIDREVDRLTKLVDNLLHMSRIEAGGLKSIERHPYYVAELIELTLPELLQRANNHQLDISVSPEMAAIPVLVDIRGVEMILFNLVENAAKYSPAESTIIVTIEYDDEQVTFHIQDNGPGIDPSHQSRIFEQFYRIKSTHQGVSGTGLGLAICKRIVEAHGGQIQMKNNPDQGACFSFSLPIDTTRKEEVDYA